MKRIVNWVLAATIICSTSAVMTACKQTKAQEGKEKTVHEGEAVVEMVNTIHHGENRGTKPVILYMFYLSQKDMPLAVQHPEIPLE